MERIDPEQIYAIYGYIRRLSYDNIISQDIINIIFIYYPHSLTFHPPTHHDPDLDHYLEYDLINNTVKRTNSIGWGSCIFGDKLLINSSKFKCKSFSMSIIIEDWGVCPDGAEINFGFVFVSGMKIHKFKWDRELGGRKNYKYSVGLWCTQNGQAIYIMSPYSRCKEWYECKSKRGIKSGDKFELIYDLIKYKLIIKYNNKFIGDLLDLKDYKRKRVIPSFSLKGFGTKIKILNYKYNY